MILLTLFLSGCSQEPMIKLSEQRQAEISALNAQMEADETEMPQQDQMTSFNRENFQTYNDDMHFEDITEFIPVQPNEVIILNEDNQLTTFYLDYVDSTLRRLQLREVKDGEITHLFYEWNQNNITRLASTNGSVLPVNQLSMLNSEAFTPFVLLTTPIQRNTIWNADNDTIAEITQLYQTATILNREYQDVVEVTYRSDNSEIVYYFAKGIGFIGSSQIAEDGSTHQVQIQEVVKDKLCEEQVIIFAPQQNENGIQLVEENSPIKWQTNDSSAAIYTRLFQQLGWMDQTVAINSIVTDNNIVTIDFTPGIVVAMNQHPTKEVGVIPAIVATLANHFNVQQVYLTVNGMGLLPEVLPYPVGGLWNVDQEWFN